MGIFAGELDALDDGLSGEALPWVPVAFETAGDELVVPLALLALLGVLDLACVDVAVLVFPVDVGVGVIDLVEDGLAIPDEEFDDEAAELGSSTMYYLIDAFTSP